MKLTHVDVPIRMGMHHGSHVRRIDGTSGDAYFWRQYWPNYPWENVFDHWGDFHQRITPEVVAWRS